jgi:ATP:ADP antiporter, AAA family
MRLRSVVAVEAGERAALGWSFAYFFCLLASYYVLRPVRDAMGIAGKVNDLPKLFLVTLAITLACTPLLTALVSRFSRRRFVPIVNRLFALQILVFALLLRSPSPTAARAFFVWTSVMNLFAVSIFWAFMADLYRREQGLRLFGFIGAGGTLGALAGSLVTATLARTFGTTALLVIAALLLEGTVHCVKRLLAHVEQNADDAPVAEGGVLRWIVASARSRYVLGIVAYMLLFTITSTLVYFEQARIVKAAIATTGGRAELFAKMDFAVNVGAFVLQSAVIGPLLRVFGVGRVLAILPLLTLAGFVVLGFAPGLAPLVVFQVARRACDYGVAKPAREVLFTVVPRDEKYKAKTFIDTFVYRGGDALGAGVMGALAAGGAILLVVAIPVCLVWGAVAVYLGRASAA